MENSELYSVGKHSYGTENIKILRWPGSYSNFKVKIGAFCSIGKNITIVGNGNHKYNRISTYPFAEMGWGPLTQQTENNYGIGDIIIGNDVWIGDNVTINSGVCICDGAIIATNSHVVKNVSAYSIVCGNPAKFIKDRFDEKTIINLLEIQWWLLPDNIIKENFNAFVNSDPSNISQFISQIQSYKKHSNF